MKANYHTHTVRCRHALGEDREYVENAIKGGFDVLGFADHCPWIFSDGFESEIRMTPAETDGYFQSLSDLKKEYASDIKIYIGFEAEYIPELIEAQDRFLRDYPVDYMIMGQHFYGHEANAPYMGSIIRDDEIIKNYVDSIIEGMDSGRYRYLAHPDLINFYGSAEAYDFHMTRLCRYMKEKNLPLEINVLGMLLERNYPCHRFFRIAQETGNKAIIGTDTHRPYQLADISLWEQAVKFAEKYNLELIDKLDGLE